MTKHDNYTLYKDEKSEKLTVKRRFMRDEVAGADMLLTTSQGQRISIVSSKPFERNSVFDVVFEVVVAVFIVEEIFLIEEAHRRNGWLQCFRRQRR